MVNERLHPAVFRQLHAPYLQGMRHQLRDLRDRSERVGFSRAWNEYLSYLGIKVNQVWDEPNPLWIKPGNSALIISDHAQLLEPEEYASIVGQSMTVVVPRSVTNDVRYCIDPEFEREFAIFMQNVAYASDLSLFPKNVKSPTDRLTYFLSNFNLFIYKHYLYKGILPTERECIDINNAALSQITDSLSEGKKVMICASGTANKALRNAHKPFGNMKNGIAKAVAPIPAEERQKIYLLATHIDGYLVGALFKGLLARRLSLEPKKLKEVNFHVSTSSTLYDVVGEETNEDKILQRLYQFYLGAFDETKCQERSHKKPTAMEDAIRVLSLIIIGSLYYPGVKRYSQSHCSNEY